jgi:hypothetical protein
LQVNHYAPLQWSHHLYILKKIILCLKWFWPEGWVDQIPGDIHKFWRPG